MRGISAAFVLVGAASAYTPFIESKAPGKVCEVSTYTVYETTYAARGTPTIAQSISTTTKSKTTSVRATPSSKVGDPYISSGSKEQDYFSDSGKNTKLKSCPHWSQNANNPKYLEPIAVGEKTQIYFAEKGKIGM